MRTTNESAKRAICAWCDAHALDVADGEVGDLVRRLQSLDTMAGCDADGIERMTTDMIHLAADRIEGEPKKAERLRALAAHISETLVAVGLTADARCFMPDGKRDSPGGVAEQGETDDDGPGTAVGEADGTPLRFDSICCTPVIVELKGKKATAFWPSSFGMVRLKPDGSRRSVVVALDELDDRNRLILRAAPVRRRTEAVVRCCVRHCNQSFRAWIRADSGIEDTKGKPINDEFGTLFAARCERHREPL